MLVVHDTPLVAEDLRETLIAAGATDVQLVPTLPEDPPSVRFDTCFLSVGSDGMAQPGLLERAARIAAHVVLIIGFVQAKPDLPPRYRARIVLTRDPDGQERCVACYLCAAACPVDCIDMVPEQPSLQNWHWDLPDPVARQVDLIATDAAPDRAA